MSLCQPDLALATIVEKLSLQPRSFSHNGQAVFACQTDAIPTEQSRSMKVNEGYHEIILGGGGECGSFEVRVDG